MESFSIRRMICQTHLDLLESCEWLRGCVLTGVLIGFLELYFIIILVIQVEAIDLNHKNFICFSFYFKKHVLLTMYIYHPHMRWMINLCSCISVRFHCSCLHAFYSFNNQY